MILNTYLKSFEVRIATKHKKFLGINLIRSFKTRYPNKEIKKVKIKEEGESFEVYDYPKDFLYDEKTLKLVRKFLNRSSRNKKLSNKILLSKNQENERNKERITYATTAKNNTRSRLKTKFTRY